MLTPPCRTMACRLAEDLERAFEQAFAALEEGPTDDSWSDEHTEVATEFAETLLQAQARFLEGLLGVVEDYGDEISSLRPPAQLADLHNTMTASIEDILREGREAAEDLEDIDTDIDSEAELEDFWTSLQSIGDSYSVSWARLEAACRGLRATLEAELGASVAICEADETREPAATPQPAAAAPKRPAGQGGSVETDREALVALYNAMDGPNWTNNENWLSDRPLREWHGVMTDASGRVISLDLFDNQLRGDLPPELGQLSNLEWLQLSVNQLSGDLPPELGQLSNLEDLSLTGNQLSGGIPAELGQLANLEELHLTGNQLRGEIPAELGRLSNLTWLSLGDNELRGEIPAELGRLPNLTWLDLGENELSGEIPAELSRLSDLESLGLWSNRLSGEIPAELGRLSNLTELWLDGNKLSGEIPAELGRRSNLTALWLGDNELSGCVPDALRDVDDNDFDELGLPFCAQE